MLVMPLAEKISWKNPPYITIFLILANIFIFFSFQLNDNENYHKAVNYYFESGLAEIEIPKYQEYINLKNQKAGNPKILKNFNHSKLSKKELQQMYGLYAKIENNKNFLDKLHNDEIILKNNDNYYSWKELRENYESLKADIVSWQYGFKPGYHRPFTFFSHMFLHGGFGHLFGNMIFLWIAGCLVESGSKRQYYFPAYIVAGIVSVCFFWLFNLHSIRPLVGASGAISGLMGIITTLYGMKKVKVFYSVGFYFNYLRVPAILLLPIWIGKELWSFYHYSEVSSTAYMAHVGGFLGGALLGYLNAKVFKLINYDALTEKKISKTPQYLEQAMECSGRLEFDKAIEILEHAYKESPEDTIILEQLFKTVKANPDSKQFHLTTKKILNLLSKNSKDYKLTYNIYCEYLKLVKGPRLPAPLFIKLCAIFSILGKTEKAEKILNFFLKKRPDMQQLPDAVFKLALAFKKDEDFKKYKYYKKILCAKYSQSNEARNIRQVS